MKSVLLLPLEFATWQQARAWSYTGSYAFVDGFAANGIDCTVLPLFRDAAGSDAAVQLERYRALVDRCYDEIWVWCVHTGLTPEFWQWVRSLAPVVVGVLMESLHFTEEELAEFPHLATRKQEVCADLAQCSHVLTCGADDSAMIRNELGIASLWYPAMVPEEFVRVASPPPPGKASFVGSCYGARRPYLKSGELDDVLQRPHLPERDSNLPERFDAACARFRTRLGNGEIANALELAIEYARLKALREELFELHLDGLRLGSANINLPSILKSYAGRVVEAMAAGVPVLSWLPPGAEQAQLFDPAEEIRHFSDLSGLRRAIEAVNTDREAAKEQVINARNKLLLRHTARLRIRQLEQWLATGRVPDYAADQGYRPTPAECAYYDELFNTSPAWSSLDPNRDEQSRWDVIERYLANIATSGSALQIAEVGCGRGWLAERLAAYGPVTAIEPVAEVALRAAQRKGPVAYLVGSVETLLFMGREETFSLVVSSEVIEHVHPDARPEFVNRLVALTRPGGHVILTTPRADIQDQWVAAYGDPDQPREDWLAEQEVKELFAAAGCSAVELQRAFLLDIYQVWLFRKDGVPAAGQALPAVEECAS